MAKRILIDLQVDTENAIAVCEYLRHWYEPGSSYQTDDGLEYVIASSFVVYGGEVEVD